ncbi:MAG: DUF2334 domain-containing protein [Acidobacteria bacterium]|nr:DUF2334 domain-containing protein [Acidobacteriota bacterium]
MSVVIVSLHDVAPATFTESVRWLELVESRGMVASLLVVPGPWRGCQMQGEHEFVSWLHEATGRGHEVALHGWLHTKVEDRLASPLRKTHAALRARGCAEFAHLSEHGARHRLERGLDVLGGAGFEPTGFVPPGWMASAGARAAMASLGFEWTTTQWQIHFLHDATTARIASISQRPGSRVTDLARRGNRSAIDLVARRHSAVRIALHPDDLRHPELHDDTAWMLDRLTVAGHRSATYGSLVPDRMVTA